MSSSLPLAIVVIGVFIIAGPARARTEPLEIFVHGANPDYLKVSRENLGKEHLFTDRDIKGYSPISADIFLRQVSSFSLFRRSSSLVSHPTTQGVSLRGTGPSGASRTLVLLDGVPVNDPFGGWVNWQQIPLHDLTRIRIAENWGSTHFSYLGLGSVIELQTREAGNLGELRMQGGTRDSFMAGGNWGHRFGAASAKLGGQYLRTKGFKTIAAGNRGDIDINADAMHGLVSGKLGYDDDRAASYLLWNAINSDRGNGTPYTNNSSRTVSIASGTRMETGPDSTARIDIFGMIGNFDSTFSSQSSDRDSESPALDQYDVPSFQAGLQGDWSAISGNTNFFEIGADCLWREAELHENFRFLDGAFRSRRDAHATQSAMGIYVFNRHHFLERWNVDIFARVNGWQNDNIRRRDTSLSSGQIERDLHGRAEFFTFFEPRLQISYALSPQASIRSSFTRGMRIPTANEIIRPFRVRNDITEGNLSLREEQILGWDTSIRYQRTSWKADAGIYVNRLTHPIANVTTGEGPGVVGPCGFVPEGGVCRQRQNLGAAYVGGLDAKLERRISENLSLSAEYLLSLSSMHDPGDSPDLKEKELAQLPRHHGNVMLKFSDQKHNFFLQGRIVGRQYEDDLNSLSLDPFIAFNLFLSRQLTKGTEIFMSAENILGTPYEVGTSKDGVKTLGTPSLFLAGFKFNL